MYIFIYIYIYIYIQCRCAIRHRALFVEFFRAVSGLVGAFRFLAGFGGMLPSEGAGPKDMCKAARRCGSGWKRNEPQHRFLSDSTWILQGIMRRPGCMRVLGRWGQIPKWSCVPLVWLIQKAKWSAESFSSLFFCSNVFHAVSSWNDVLIWSMLRWSGDGACIWLGRCLDGFFMSTDRSSKAMLTTCR